MPSVNAKHKTIDEYLAGLSNDKRDALEKLRETIRAIVPKVEECISYGLAAFLLKGRALVGFGATDSHCAFYPMSSTTVEAHKDELKEYDTTKGIVRFHAANPLPAPLVRRLIEARLVESGMSQEAMTTSHDAELELGRVTGKDIFEMHDPARGRSSKTMEITYARK
jgi:uncharacterized protein YdhG (YjbR/CyaY superfamily)